MRKDFIEYLFVANTHSYILFFSNKGKVYWLKVHNIPEAGRQAKGKAIVNLLNLKQGEKISAFIEPSRTPVASATSTPAGESATPTEVPQQPCRLVPLVS